MDLLDDALESAVEHWRGVTVNLPGGRHARLLDAALIPSHDGRVSDVALRLADPHTEGRMLMPLVITREKVTRADLDPPSPFRPRTLRITYSDGGGVVITGP